MPMKLKNQICILRKGNNELMADLKRLKKTPAPQADETATNTNDH